MTKKGVPEGWLPVSAIGKPISGTRFLAFKVPLKDTLCNNLQPDDRFSPAMLLEKEPKLRLIIDLTNTKRYYDKAEFEENGVNYEKIFCPGREVPPRHMMKKFFHVVDNFMKSEDTEDKFIGVHCTHGINRTGYFICTYMIQKLGFTPDKAISAFQEARGHEMVRECYIHELMKDPATFLITEELEGNKDHSLPHRNRNHHRPLHRHSRGGPSRRPSPPRHARHRGRPHFSQGPAPKFGRPSSSFHQQSQLNYYDDENHHNRFSWRSSQNRRGRGYNN